MGEGLFHYMYCKRREFKCIGASSVVGKLRSLCLFMLEINRYRLLCLRCKVDVNISTVSIPMKLCSTSD